MKKNLGRVLLFLLFCLHLVASEYKWSSEVSKTEAYVNEAIYLKYVCAFNDRAELYSIEFNPVTETDTYKVELLSQTTKIVDAKKVNTYEYIVFVKKPMLLEFNFDTLMKKTTQGSIESTVLGRDNAEKEQFSIQEMKQERIQIQIKDTPKELVGTFSMDVQKDTPEVKAYEPFHLDISISGEGNFNAFKELEFIIDEVKVFTQKPIQNTKLSTKGYKGSWSQKFAFVSAKDFIIPTQSIEYFDVKSKNLKVLHIEAIDVKVQKAYKKSELLDEVEESFKFNFEYLYYLLTFLAGFLVAKIKFKTKKLDTKNTQLRDKIRNTKSLDELSMLLILNNQRKFNDILTLIDSDELQSLMQAKNQAIKLITDD